jgi:gluconolactonase
VKRAWIGIAALAACRIDPECFGTSECSEGRYCFERECVPVQPDRVTFTWWGDVEPIVRARCQTCHGAPLANGAPLTFVTYADVTEKASTGLSVHREMYRRVTSARAPMPPAPNPLLMEREVDVIRTWTRDGAPEGEPPVTWLRDVQPIVARGCGCHGEPTSNDAPMSLVTYEHTQAIRPGGVVHALMARRTSSMAQPMPPSGQLPIGEVNTIGAWSRIGAPRGTAAGLDGGVADTGVPPTPSPLEGLGILGEVSSGFQSLDGPSWSDATGALVVADPAADTVYTLSPPAPATPIRTPSGRANGTRFDASDRLLFAEHETRSITRREAGGAIATVADRFLGDRFNSPHDLAVRLRDGTLYFTDPPIGLAGRPKEIAFNGVFRVAPDGTVTAEWQGPESAIPTGVDLSPDESILYVSDRAANVVRAFDVGAGGALSGERLFASTEPEPSGIALDEDGNVFVATSIGVMVFASNGYLWGTIPIAEPCTNVAFGGSDRRTLYVTTSARIYAVNVQIPGTRWLAPPPDAGTNPVDGVPAAQAFGPMTYQFLEGPEWDAANGRLLFSDIPGDTIYQYVPPNDFSVLRTPSRMANGLAIEAGGTILICEHEGRAVTRLLPNDTTEIVAGLYMGLALNSPNDVTLRSDGTIYFTDPDYGLAGRPRGVAFHGLYRVSPQGALSAEWEGQLTERPNGVALSPDESTLYLTDTENRRVYRFGVGADGSLSDMGLFADAMGTSPDGLAVDRDGNVYLASSAGIEVFHPNGTRWGVIAVPESPSNLTFGGPELRTLYITTARTLYRVDVPIAGN